MTYDTAMTFPVENRRANYLQIALQTAYYLHGVRCNVLTQRDGVRGTTTPALKGDAFSQSLYWYMRLPGITQEFGS